MKKILFVCAMVLVAVLIVWGARIFMEKISVPPAPVHVTNGPLIGFSLGTLREERWATDKDLFTKKTEQLGALVVETESDYDVPTQISQIENLVAQGVKVIVVVPADSEAIAPAIEMAHEAGVKIIAYDRLIKNSDVDMYVTFDNAKVGEMQAQGVLNVASSGNFAYIGGSPTDNNAYILKQGSMSVLEPKIKSGAIKLVLDSFTPDWKPDEAYKTVKNYLDSGKTLNGVIAANDGTAFGVIQALAEKGLAGKVPVSGQDAEISACQRVVQGTQTMTVYKPIKSLADMTAEIAVAMALQQKPRTNSVTNNGKVDVPTFLLTPVAVTKANMVEAVVDSGFHTYYEIYQTTTKQ